MHGGKIGFLQQEQKNKINKQQKAKKKENTHKIGKNTTAVHAQHVCRQHATPPTKLQKKTTLAASAAAHTNHDIKKRKAATKICILMRFTCFAEPKNREVFHFPHFSILPMHAETTHSCVANVQICTELSTCVSVCVRLHKCENISLTI